MSTHKQDQFEDEIGKNDREAEIRELSDEEAASCVGGLELSKSSGTVAAVEQYRKVVEHGNPIYSTRSLTN